ncbi:cobalamin B12-binding domain-containing protein [Histidinibacterium lentulum]|uniref:B12-binding domain-containing protein n=1 Tax=Histidinibacterium lentulum TaxID=2480588 RepID=A0A3N2QSW2_9RHOB|nr:cobalamin-dependent protein [Histidinibacterium lentulum]ROT98105.1 hypothetical protein EAT49_17735 [Histidinibacterium lentulum]
MGQQPIPIEIDAEVFARSTTLFDLKRTVLAPEAIAALASDIVRGLAQGGLARPAAALPDIDESESAAFCARLIEPDPDGALRFIADRRAEGLSRRDVYLGYVGAAARKLGADWEADRLSFAQVTIGTGHLYALMRALKTEGGTGPQEVALRKHALFATVPRETHGIGITVAAEVFRGEGWEIDLEIGLDHDGIIAAARQTRAQVIGLSLSTEERLQDLIRLVLGLRLVVPGAIIGVATGDAFDDDKVAMFADIDLLFADAPTACADLERLIRARR